MSIKDISNYLATSGVEHNFVIGGDLRIAKKLSVNILKDKTALKQIESVEKDLRKLANRGDLTLEVAYEKFEAVVAWFVRLFAKKHPEQNIEHSSVKDVIKILVDDFKESLGGNLAVAASENEADCYTHVKFGVGTSGIDAFQSFIHALKPFMIFGLKSFKQGSNGNWVARGRYIVLEFGATNPTSLLKGRGVIEVNFIKATTPTEDWERKFDSILREFTDSFLKHNAERVYAALDEDQLEARDKAARSALVKIKKAGIAPKGVSTNNERVRVEIPGVISKNIKKLKAALIGWKVSKEGDDETVFAKGDIRISLREKGTSTFIRIRHKAAKDWAGRTAKKGTETGNHVGIPPKYLGLVALPKVYGLKTKKYQAVRFQGRRTYFYKPTGISEATLAKLLTKSPVLVNKYVRANKVEIAAVYDEKTKKPYVSKTVKKAK